MPSQPLNLAVLVSGSGTTLQNLIDQIARKEVNARISLVIGSKAGIKGLDRATSAGIPASTVQRKDCASITDFSQRVFAMCDEARIDLVCLGGWLSLLELPDRYAGRAMNIHPALLPSFGGKGMYGRHVHQAVIDNGCKVSGCTVHFMDNTYDTGPIILQRTCPVMENDDASTLAARVFEEEKIAYPQAIRLFAEGRLKIEGKRVRIA